jgi:hypothetical protein
MTTIRGAAPEAETGQPPFAPAELPVPPTPRGLGWLAVVGPGVIVLGAAIGGGEFLLGPSVFVRHGLSLLWATSVAVFFQTIFNTELMRYTLATGEPVLTGFMRTRPRPAVWATVYSLAYVLQVGWPASAGLASGAIFYVFNQRMAGPADATVLYAIGVCTFLLCVLLLLTGRRVERTLEVLNWMLVTCTMLGFVALALWLVPASNWFAVAAGFTGFSTVTGRFDFLPADADAFLIAAFVAYSGAGGMVNVTLANWARDKGYGMGQRTGFIASAVGGQQTQLKHSGFMFTPDAEGLRRWRGWWRIVRADQWGIFFTGAMVGMALPGMLYVTLLEPGTNIQGLGISAALADAIGARGGPTLAFVVAVLGAWLLFKTQLDLTEGLVRAVTDILWAGSSRVRAWRGGDVRAVYYSVLGVAACWGIVALRLAQPIMLLQIAANVAACVFVVASLHLLYLNTKFLPVEIRPSMARRVILVAMSAFYGYFVFNAITG